MNTEELINALVDQARPVKMLDNTLIRMGRWCVLAILSVFIVAIIYGFRADSLVKLHDPVFFAENAFLIVLFCVSSWSALRLSVPGLSFSRFLPVLSAATWIGLVLFRYAFELHNGMRESIGLGMVCVSRILFLGTIPCFIFFRSTQKFAPLNRGWAGLFIATGSFSLSVLGTQFICANDGPLHILVWHVVPFGFTVLIGAALGCFVFGSKTVKFRLS